MVAFTLGIGQQVQVDRIDLLVLVRFVFDGGDLAGERLHHFVFLPHAHLDVQVLGDD